MFEAGRLLHSPSLARCPRLLKHHRYGTHLQVFWGLYFRMIRLTINRSLGRTLSHCWARAPSATPVFTKKPRYFFGSGVFSLGCDVTADVRRFFQNSPPAIKQSHNGPSASTHFSPSVPTLTALSLEPMSASSCCRQETSPTRQSFARHASNDHGLRFVTRASHHGDH